MELSIREAAELLGRSERTLRHLAQGGRLPARRIGARWVIRRDDLEEWARTEASATERAAEDLTTHSSTIPDADETTPTLTGAVTEPAVEAAEPRPRARAAPHTPSSSPPEPAFTVSFEALIPSAPGAREPGSARDLDAFAIATALLSELTHARRHPSADASLLADPERALLDFLQLIADGAHHRDPRRQSERFREAQSRACAALSGLVHYNIAHDQPDLSALAAQIDGPLLSALHELQAATARRLTWRGRLVTAAESVAHRLLDRARHLSGSERLSQHLDDFERSLTRALRYAL